MRPVRIHAPGYRPGPRTGSVVSACLQALKRAVGFPGVPGIQPSEPPQHVKMPPPRAVSAVRGHDQTGYFFLPWFFTASMAAFAASGSRYVPPGFSGLKSASSS